MCISFLNNSITQQQMVESFGNYMRKCASGGQSLANAERGVGLSVPVQKIKFSINNLPVYVS